MVGYDANETLTQRQKLLVGCLSGVTTKFVVQPMDVIKIRSQLLRKPKQRFATYRVARRILWEEGITAFWHGHCLGQVHSILGVSSQFYVYEITTKLTSTVVPRKYKYWHHIIIYQQPVDLRHFIAIIILVGAQIMMIMNLIGRLLRHVEHFICGVLAGCVCTVLIIPLEVIRVRQILVKDQYKNLFHGAATVYRYGGITAFYEGLSASLLQMGPQVGIQFATFNFAQPLLLHLLAKPCAHEECKNNKHKVATLALASSMAASLSGFMAKTLTYPLDLAKRRLQINTHRTSMKYKTPTQAQSIIRCHRLFHCLTLAYKREGIRGLYRGWAVTVYKAQLTSVAAFTSYEVLCFIARELYHVEK